MGATYGGWSIAIFVSDARLSVEVEEDRLNRGKCAFFVPYLITPVSGHSPLSKIEP